MTDSAEIWVPVPQNNSKNNGNNFTRGHMGQIPVIRCFVQNFYMVAYVTKAGLGPRARDRIVVPVILSVVDSCSTALRLSALPVLSILLVVLRWGWYSCSSRLASPSVTRPARPEPL